MVFFLAEDQELSWFVNHCQGATDLKFSKNKMNALKKLRSLVNLTPGTVIHSHSFQPGVWGRFFHSRSSIGFLSTVHSPYPYFLKNSFADRIKAFTEQYSINRVHHPVVAVSQAVRQHLLDQTQIDPELIQVIRNGLDIRSLPTDSKLDPGIREKVGLKPQEKMVVAVARLSFEKGGDVLLRAWQILVRGRGDLKLVVVGDGSELEKLQKMAGELEIQNSVFFAGFQSDVYSWLSGADLFVNSSRFEGLPMSILEASVLRIPIVATAVGGVPEVIQDGATGILVESENPKALAQAMASALDHPARAKELAEAGWRHVIANHDIRDTVKEYEDLYRDIHLRLGFLEEEKKVLQ